MNDDYKNIIRDVINNNIKNWKHVLRKEHNDVYEYVMTHKPEAIKGNSVSEIFYWFLNDMTEYKKCPVCRNEIYRFYGIIKGYQNHCSKECAAKDPERAEKIKNNTSEESRRTRIEKIHLKTLARTDEDKKLYREKSRRTRLERYGSETYVNLDKQRQTMLKKYGFESVLQSPEIKQKINITRAKSYYQKTFLNNDYLEALFTEDEFVKSRITQTHLVTEFKWRCKRCNNVFTSVLNGNWFTKGVGRCYARCPICYPILNNYLHSRREIECAKIIKNMIGDEPLLFDESEELKHVIPGYLIDIYIPSMKIAFEFNGLRWHNTEAIEKNYHLNKSCLCEQNGIKMMHIWEDEWDFSRETVIDDIRCILDCGVKYDWYDENRIVVDRAKFNRLCSIEGYTAVGETDVLVKRRTNDNGISYNVEDSGYIIYLKNPITENYVFDDITIDGVNLKQFPIGTFIGTRSMRGNPKSIVQVDATSGILIRKWESVSEAGNNLHLNNSNISHALHSKTHLCGGFKWYESDVFIS